MIKSPFKKIQDVDLKHLKRLVANDVRPKIVYIRRSPRTFIWTSNGKIYLRKERDSSAILIKNEEELNKLKR